jgi:Rieske Fe-S protein
MTKSPHISRREFVAIFVGALGTIMAVAVGLPAIGYLISPSVRTQKTDAWVSLGPLENYPVGEPSLFTFTRARVNGWEKTVNSYGVYVWRETEEKVTTYSNWCTHEFDIFGDVVAGPPPRPLDEYENKVEEGVLFIRLEQA